MTPLEMITEWRRGCSVAIKGMGHRPEECEECTRNLIEAMERNLLAQAKAAVDAMTDEQRYALLSQYCQGCGSKDTSCTCMRDD